MTNKFRVEFREHTRVAPDKSFIEVCQIWEGVDRPYVGGYSVGMSKPLANRLKRAMEAGVAFPFRWVAVDNGGATFVHTEYNINCRYMNAELRNLGY
jgi:hypothetical protein